MYHLLVHHFVMSARMRHNAPLLHLLSGCHAKQRKAILETLTDEQLKTLCEVVLNILKGTVDLPPKQKQKLRKG